MAGLPSASGRRHIRADVRRAVSQCQGDGYCDWMAVYDRDSTVNHPLDFRLAVGGSVTLFWSTEVLRSSVTWLSANGYRLVHLDASKWRDESDMHTDLASALDFPAYYGRNLDALNDCLGDVAVGDYGLTDGDTGLALVIQRIDLFMRRQPVVGHHLFDALAGTAREGALFGNRILCLAQSDDPDLVIPPIGASHVPWNDAEWLDSKRHPGA